MSRLCLMRTVGVVLEKIPSKIKQIREGLLRLAVHPQLTAGPVVASKSNINY